MGDPVRPAGGRPGERDPRQRWPVAGEVVQVVGEVIAGRAAGDVQAVRVDEPREASVQLGLVAELERLDGAAADAGARACWPRRRRRPVVVSRSIPRISSAPSSCASAAVTCNHRSSSVNRTPRGLARPAPATTTSRCCPRRSADGALVRREVADQLLEHRVDRLRVGAGVRRDRGILERQPEEPGRDRPARCVGGPIGDWSIVLRRGCGVRARRARGRSCVEAIMTSWRRSGDDRETGRIAGRRRDETGIA